MNSGITEQWNKFVAEHGPKSGAFLQSWEWGEFQQACARNIFRYIITPAGLTRIDAEIDAEQRGNILGTVQVVKMPLPMGKSYLYVPRGPILKISNDKFLISNLGKLLENLAKKENAIFTKIELPVKQENFNPLLPPPGIRGRIEVGVKNIQPQNTLILNLEKSEDELLRDMHEKTRYNIRLAERKGVEVRSAREETLEKDIETFWKLAEKTAARDKFSYHPKKYYKKMLSPSILPLIKGEDGGGGENLAMKLIIAEKNGEPLGANIITFFGNTATYLHGASNHEHRELMAPHLLQWRAIQETKKLGYDYYDFWGIKSMNQESRIRNQGTDGTHPWSGITRFKLGFGGEQVHYAPTIDLPMSSFWYNLYRLAKSMRP